jgi:ubiquitin-conjugating enzyme E2 O
MSVGESSGSGDMCKNTTSMSLNSIGSDSEISFHNDDEDMIDDDALEDPDDGSDYYDDEEIYEDEYSFLQDQFDNVDLPPGVEASVPWLKDVECKPAGSHANSESSSKAEVDESTDAVMQKFRQFKQFDTVDSIPDHHYDKIGASAAETQVIYVLRKFF